MDRKANSESRLPLEDIHSYPPRAQVPVRRTIPGMDSDLYSILTGTDSTMSNLTGAGRTLDGWLSRGGRFIETAVTAAASRMGAGPTSLFKRLLIPRALKFTSLDCTCSRVPTLLKPIQPSVSKVIQLAERDIAPPEARSPYGDRETEWKISLRMAMNLSQRLFCSSCRRGYELAVATEPSFTRDCHGMIKYTQRDANPTSRELALFYIYLLWYLNSEFQRAMVSFDFGDRLLLLEKPVSFVAAAFSYQLGWLASELQLLVIDASLRLDMAEHDYDLRPRTEYILPIGTTKMSYRQPNLVSDMIWIGEWFPRDRWLIQTLLGVKPQPKVAEVDILIRLFDGLAITAFPRHHNSLISGLLRFSMSRIFGWDKDPAALISLLKARLQQRPQDCLGHIDLSPTPPQSMHWPMPYDYFGSSKKLLMDYSALCSDADVSPLNILGLVTKVLSESLEHRLVDWIRSVLPDLQPQISSGPVLGQPLWSPLPRSSGLPVDIKWPFSDDT